MGSTHKPKSTRAQKARSVNPSPKSRRKPAPSKPFRPHNGNDARHNGASDRVPADIEIAIHEERGSLIDAMSIFYGLHCILLRQQEERVSETSEAAEDAAKWASLTALTEMLLVKLHTVLKNLDNIARGITNVVPQDVAMAELARGQSQVQGGAE